MPLCARQVEALERHRVCFSPLADEFCGCSGRIQGALDGAQACLDQLPKQTINGVAVPMPACPAACWNVVQLTTGEEAANCPHPGLTSGSCI